MTPSLIGRMTEMLGRRSEHLFRLLSERKHLCSIHGARVQNGTVHVVVEAMRQGVPAPGEACHRVRSYAKFVRARARLDPRGVR